MGAYIFVSNIYLLRIIFGGINLKNLIILVSLILLVTNISTFVITRKIYMGNDFKPISSVIPLDSLKDSTTVIEMEGLGQTYSTKFTDKALINEVLKSFNNVKIDKYDFGMIYGLPMTVNIKSKNKTIMLALYDTRVIFDNKRYILDKNIFTKLEIVFEKSKKLYGFKKIV